MSAQETSSSGDRLQKIIAQAGLASRRDAEELIRDGKVTVNGKTAKLGDKAVLGKDSIKVRGKLIHSTEKKAYYLIYKPKNVIAVMNEDDEGRTTLKEYIKRIPERVFTVGKMDFTGEGAILLTNDGEIAQKMQKANDIIRRYHVKVDRHPTPGEIEKLSRGARMDGKSLTPVHVRLANAYNKNALVEISFEGMHTIDIRKYFENKGFFPERIACVGIGHINADKMPAGSIRKIEGSSIQALFTQPELAQKEIEKLLKKKSRLQNATDETIAAKPVMTVPDSKKSLLDRVNSFDATPEGEAAPSPFARARTPRGDTRSPRAEGRTQRPEGRSDFSRSSARPARNERPARSDARTTRFGESRAPRTDFRVDRPARSERPARGNDRPARSEGRPSAFGAARSARAARPALRSKRA